MTPRLSVEGLQVRYPLRGGVLRRVRGWVRAVDDAAFEIPAGTTFGLVGESGCGKSSLARAILRLQPASGRIRFLTAGGDTVDIATLEPRGLRRMRREMQIVFQDSQSALNPRLSIGRILDESLRALVDLPAPERKARAASALEEVGLAADAGRRYAHEFSGGQRQRIAIARALISRPSFVVLDEPVSALDVSVRAQILNLLLALQRDRGLTYLFVSHDLSVVRYLCDRLAVMYLGRLVEAGPTSGIFARPLHPYTEQLLAAVPQPDPRRRRERPRLQGDPPSPLETPTGCPFHTRCPHADAACRERFPPARDAGGGHVVHCHHPLG
ncbi:MAG: ATP-binding cassette domain-containing protein [Alphaproteobacteria bacterium]|nr:ATP-binding cassette domain-containing protein [Alphaproteobacteria bacterium]